MGMRFMCDDSYCETRETLLQRIKNRHDDSAWADFAYYYRGYIYNLVRRMGLDHHDAEEIVQMVLLKSWRKLPTFDYDPGKGRFRGWLCRVAGNAARNFIRDNKRKTISLDEEREGDKSKLIPSVNPEIDKIAEDEWINYLPQLAWKNLENHFEENTKTTYQMLAAGDTVENVAEKLGISTNTVYVHKKRVKDRLREEVLRLDRELC